MAHDPIVLERKGAIAYVRFNRPDVLNALDTPSADALLRISRELAADEENRVVVLSGAGRAFMAGGDIAEFSGGLAARSERINGLIDKLHQAILNLTSLRSPVIASVQGAVAGAGVSIMLACDIALEADNMLLNVAYAKIGASPDGSLTWSLPRIVGVRKAIELAMLSDNITAEEALRLGLVNRVIPVAELAAETAKLAERLARGPTIAYGKLKVLMRTSHERTLYHQLDAERLSFLSCNKTSDFEHGVSAFLTKSNFDFEGK